ncbi:DUF4142 domain-containing protein [Massilia sp. Dwa41.01b]|uniref:DUF4142 domain-containing protein n=1 Tax=unclassified Massilia TaxID=2609279 RepID=UPI0016012CEC|nr:MULTISPECIES: DUF4142 domain-containing protein [unclassified Massilia]QNA87448.1 DUF4142 domain-containing protein [Massilia sp. Dwa41.01b]QNA98353.1 DUF4142 domain-containing protein [Massilia sp. Se16.2.3]
MASLNPVQVRKYLKGVDYPVSRAALLDSARSMGADEALCASIEQLPGDAYQTPADVSQALGRLLPGGAPWSSGADGASVAGTPTGGLPRDGSDAFLVLAMQDAMAEIQVCELALEKSGKDAVHAFAQAMIDEHGRMGRDIEQLAARKGLPTPQTIRPEQEMTVEELASLSGRDFEQRWIQYNIDLHERDVKLFRQHALDQRDSEIRALAGQIGEALAGHLQMAHELGKTLAIPEQRSVGTRRSGTV